MISSIKILHSSTLVLFLVTFISFDINILPKGMLLEISADIKYLKTIRSIFAFHSNEKPFEMPRPKPILEATTLLFVRFSNFYQFSLATCFLFVLI